MTLRAAGAALAAAAGALAVAAALAMEAPEASREVRLVMGTPAEVAVSGAPGPAASLSAAFTALQRVDDEMTLWRSSPLTALNDAGGGRVSEELFAVLGHALEVARDSGGAFDPTVEPLVRAAGALGTPPRPLRGRERAQVARRVGAGNVRLLPGREVRLLRGARVDLGGIAKGYAADRALDALRRAGATAGMVDLGSSSVAVFGSPLEIAIADPQDRAAPPWGTFRLHSEALGTSGAAERGAHIFDPRRARPAARVLSATVVARTAMEADALSTALFVLGAESGLRLLQRRGAAGFVLTRESGRPVITATAGFAAAHALRAAPGVETRAR